MSITMLSDKELKLYQELKTLSAKYDFVIGLNPRKFTEIWEYSKMADHTLDQTITVTMLKQRTTECNNTVSMTFDWNSKDFLKPDNSQQ